MNSFYQKQNIIFKWFNTHLSVLMQEGFRFCIIGIIGASINLIVFLFFLNLIKINYILCGIIGFLSPIPIIYQLNKVWTFNKKKLNKLSLIYYYLVCIFGLFIHTLLLYFFTSNLEFHPLISQIPAITGSTISNFFLSKFIVFKENNINNTFK